ncbi:metal-dependent hydrolase [Amycolatopsis sp. DG1A-15b]|uniref:metal-dependent hydrolase n=1 Tax=Amycolatopsis sp. DG1A-15b TaxID=3052846 RepID=UPI00255BFF06|nr:metal-dependent hydrolase [Amycolatopsis sp. DG1A-15b]WIX92406.1 metal-dependent hydrolase [Amycolatopsis sp. DG1A-15b]
MGLAVAATAEASDHRLHTAGGLRRQFSNVPRDVVAEVAFERGTPRYYTAVVGEWLLGADRLERAGMHPAVLDLIRWHGAEEVEHRNVAFDAFMHVDGSYARRVRTALLASFTLAVLFLTTARYLLFADPTPGVRRSWVRQLVSATQRGLIPKATIFLTEIPKYLRPGFHPSQLGSMDAAIRYLARSPAASPEARP